MPTPRNNQSGTNIAKGESGSKRETKFHELILPSRLLYSRMTQI